MPYYDDDQLWECEGCEALIPRQAGRCARCGHPVEPRPSKVQCFCGDWIPKPPGVSVQCKRCNRWHH